MGNALGGVYRALAALSEIEVDWRAGLPDGVDGMYVPGDPPVILVRLGLTQAERRATISHELVHHARGGGAWFAGQPASWDAVVVREEATVDRIAAVRLAPLDLVARLVEERVSVEEAVTAEWLAEALDDVGHGVPVRWARLLLDELVAR